ncbi:MAG: ATP-dependent helicase [Alphaproteobacteria bacterium]
MSTPYLRDLNPQQREAVEQTEGPLLVLAGAGTGKTRVLTTRIAHILALRLAHPGQILAVTFTNRAAREMQERVANMVGQSVEGLRFLGTFHAICAKMLRRHAERIGLQPDFTILDSDDQLRLIKQLLDAENIDEKKYPARTFAHMVDRWKNRGLAPKDIQAEDVDDFAQGRSPELYQAYQQRLSTLNATDFGDLLLHAITLLRDHDDIRQQYRSMLRYLMVDEYQDTNVAQYLWLRLLCPEQPNLACVGDDDQSIYGWRGAEVGNILRFERDFPGAEIIRLEQNYRSKGHILQAAGGLIDCNRERLGKSLWTEDELGEPIRITSHWDSSEEARAIGDAIHQLQEQGVSRSQMAVLVRASSQMRDIEERFLNQAISYRVIGGPRFYERLEIRDALAYFRLVAQPRDDLAFERIVNRPKRGIGSTTIQKLNRLARASQMSLLDAADVMANSDEIGSKPRQALGAFVDLIRRWRQQSQDMDHINLASMILDESGYTEMLKNEKTAEAHGRLENLKELVRGLEEFQTMAGFLEHVSLVMDNERDDNPDKVTIMTLHGAKGLEFDNVFLPGWEEGLFPSQRTLDELGNRGLEEERRLAYVGLTRARVRAMISTTANRRTWGQWQPAIPSRFIDEIPPENILVTAPETQQLGSWHQSGTALPTRFGGPGWQRMKANPVRRPPSQMPVFDDDSPSHAIGMRVFHQKFGYGEILALDGQAVEVSFDKAGQKKVMGAFLEKVGN